MRRINLRRDDGVAMTEFALILPVFMLIIVGLLVVRTRPLLLDRDEPRRERDRALGRRRPEPVRPGQTLQEHAAQSSTGRSSRATSGSASTSRRPRRPRAERLVGCKVQKPFTFVPFLERRDDHDPRHSTMRIENFTDTADPIGRRPTRRLQGTSGPAREPAATEERGGILVLGAVMIPVFLLMTALVIDVGNWYTHNRQLQNRADAAAFAAGVEYAKNWKACVISSNAGVRQATANEIADAARQYAGDPEASDYSTGPLPAAPEHGDREPVEASTSSSTRATDYTDDTDYTDGGVGGRSATRATSPAQPRGQHLAGRWPMDGRAGSRRTTSRRSSARSASRSSRTRRARARRDPPGAQRAPVPAARGARTTSITKVQVRYYNECTRPGHAIASSTTDLGRSRTRSISRAGDQGGGTLWATRELVRGAGRRATSQRSSLTLPIVRRLRRLPAGRRGGPAREPRRDRHRPDVRATHRGDGTPTASTGSRRSASGTTAARQPGPRIDERHADRRLRRARRRLLRPAPRRRDRTARSTRTVEVNWGDRDDRPTLDVTRRTSTSP